MHLVYANYTYFDNKGKPQLGWRFMALDTSTHYPKLIPADQFQYQEIAVNNDLNLRCVREIYLDPNGIMYQRLLFINFSIQQNINNIVTYYDVGALTAYAHYDSATSTITGFNLGYQCALTRHDPIFNNMAYQKCFQEFLMPFLGTPQMLQEATSVAATQNTATTVETSATTPVQNSTPAVEATLTQNITSTVEETVPVIEPEQQQANIFQALPTLDLANQATIPSTAILVEEAEIKPATPELLPEELVISSEYSELARSTTPEVIEASKEPNITIEQITAKPIALSTEMKVSLEENVIVSIEEVSTPILKKSIQSKNDTDITEPLEAISETIPTIADSATEPCENTTPTVSIASESPTAESESEPKAAVNVAPQASKAKNRKSKNSKPKETESIVPKPSTPKPKASKAKGAVDNRQSPVNILETDDSDVYLDQIIAAQKHSAVAVVTTPNNVNTGTLSAFQRCKSRAVTMFSQLQAPELSSVQALGIANLCVIYFVMVFHNPDFTKLKTGPNWKINNDLNKFFLDCFLANSMLDSSVFLYKSLKHKA